MMKLNDLHEFQEDRPYANLHLDSVYPCMCKDRHTTKITHQYEQLLAT